MKFYRLTTPWRDLNIFETYPGVSGKAYRGIPKANGDTVTNGKELMRLIGTPDFDTSNLPIFDYFHLETSDRSKKLWEWCLNDIHQIEGLYSPSTFSLFVSPKVKDILSKYVIAEPFGFVQSKLKYKSSKLDYFIFCCFRYCRFDETVFNESIFQIFNDAISRKELIGDYHGKIENYEGFKQAEKEIREKLGRGDILFKKAVLTKYYDFFMVFNDRFFYVSERLKNALEENGITGIEFEEETDIEFHFLETPVPIGNSL